jgi:hypothetical protein
VKAGEIEPNPLASLAPMTLQIGHADLPNRVCCDAVWVGCWSFPHRWALIAPLSMSP